MDSSWFEALFGFKEVPLSFEQNKSKFSVTATPSSLPIPSPAPHLTLKSLANKNTFDCGPFEAVSIKELRKRFNSLPPCNQGSLTFKHIIGDAMSLHRDPINEGSVFQAASQFNALEMIDPGVTPAHGITIYVKDKTQGPACALSCPAATIYRNYLHPMQTGKPTAAGQINLMEGVENHLLPKSYWTIKNGYLLPTDSAALKSLTQRFKEDPELYDRVVGEVQVACQWNTEVWDGIASEIQALDFSPRKQMVTQVFTSACPISYSRFRSEDWELLATACLEAAFEGTLLVAACLSRQQAKRIPVHLTNVGGGAFGNKESWIKAAIKGAIKGLEAEAIDVKLVHYGRLPDELF